MKFINIVFFHALRAFHKAGAGDYSIQMAITVVGLLSALNLFTALCIIQILYGHVIYSGKGSFFLIAPVIGAYYFYFLRGDRIDKILQLYFSREYKYFLMNRIIVWVYAIITFVSFFYFAGILDGLK